MTSSNKKEFAARYFNFCFSFRGSFRAIINFALNWGKIAELLEDLDASQQLEQNMVVF